MVMKKYGEVRSGFKRRNLKLGNNLFNPLSQLDRSRNLSVLSKIDIDIKYFVV